MPVLDGYEATAGIRQYEEATQRFRTPVIALTAHAYGSEANLWQQSGMDACVTKPFTLGSLQSALSTLLSSRVHCEPLTISQSINEGQIEPKHDVIQNDNPTQILDLDVLAGISEMQRDGDNLVERIITLYAEHAPKALQALLELEDTEDCEAVAAAAHALKSLSRNVGALALGDLCDEIRDRGKRGNCLADACPRACSRKSYGTDGARTCKIPRCQGTQ